MASVLEASRRSPGWRRTSGLVLFLGALLGLPLLGGCGKAPDPRAEADKTPPAADKAGPGRAGGPYASAAVFNSTDLDSTQMREMGAKMGKKIPEPSGAAPPARAGGQFGSGLAEPGGPRPGAGAPMQDSRPGGTPDNSIPGHSGMVYGNNTGDKPRKVKPEPPKAPQVWHRDASRPTFARVYVGDNNSLELVSLHVAVTVEGPRARTLVDHVFRNPHDSRLEGTFEYPLPAGASPSYFAMFLGQTRDTAPPLFARRGDNPPLPENALARLSPSEITKQISTADWGKLQEAHIVNKEKALETYEEIVRGRIDPALLEYAGGNTFSGRVFPIPPRGYNRVLIAYEELLPVTGEQQVYRFPLPGRKLAEMRLTLSADAKECLQASFQPGDSTKEESGGRLTFSRTWTDASPEGDAVFACTPARPRVQAVSGRQGDNGPRYLYARVRPEVPALDKTAVPASHAVFLLDTSLSEHPDRFAVSMKLLQKILESDPDIREFNILTFNTAAWVEPKGWLANTAEGRTQAMAKLDGLLLEGATDLSCALDKLCRPGFDIAAGTAVNCFLLSDGHLTWGESDPVTLAARFEKRCPLPVRFHCYRTGLGEENAELYEALTRAGGGVFQCFGEAEVAAAAKAHRSECLHVERVRFAGGPEAADVLVAGRKAAVYPGGELVVAGRFPEAGRTTLVLEGSFQGKKVVQEFPLEIASGSELAPRAWAEVAVASLLALHDDSLDPLVTAYCQQFGVGSRVASFLVLENENDYKRLNLEEERGKTVAGDLGAYVESAWTQRGKDVGPRQEWERFLGRVDKRIPLLREAAGGHVRKLLEVLSEDDLALPEGELRGMLRYEKDAAPEYLEGRKRERRDVAVYLAEARRRADKGDVDGAVGALSSVVEEHPGRGDALRLAGYRLLDLHQAAHAAHLFSRVQRQRPFEPHSYRDLARALEDAGRPALAALQYEIVLAGTWHNRFGASLKQVAQEEYASLMQESIRRKLVRKEVANLFGERLEGMTSPQPKGDLRVTISWNTDGTDVDLWVIEPGGNKVFYQNPRSPSGGELSQDQTQGYGPERYRIARAQAGAYKVLVHYFSPNRNLLGGETHVHVNVTRFAGTPQETTERHTVILKKHNEAVEVCNVKF
jgi:tetratricopeptide (TPR) repeat protein